MSNERKVSGEFIELVRRMRAAQNVYFKDRYRSDLNKARSLERRVDAWLEKNLAEIYLVDTWQGVKQTDETPAPYEVVDGEEED